MTSKESKKLKIGDNVVFSDGVCGKVTEANWHAVKVEWADDQVGIISHDDMQDVSKVTQLPPGTAHGLKPNTVGDSIYRQFSGGPSRRPHRT